MAFVAFKKLIGRSFTWQEWDDPRCDAHLIKYHGL